MKVAAYLLGAMLATYSVVGGIRVDFTPTYMIVALPSDCTQGKVWEYTAPTQQYYTSLIGEVLTWLKNGN